MRIVGLDLGRKRIGVALSDVSGTLATPWRTLDGTGSVGEVAHRLVTVLSELADSEDGVGGVVVGLPSHLDGRPHEGATWVRQVADAVRLQVGLPVALQDERLTSVEAEQRLAVREHDWRKRKARLDAAAAAVFLQEYLDTRPRDTTEPVS
jgi:putative Holliday junction resolvase